MGAASHYEDIEERRDTEHHLGGVEPPREPTVWLPLRVWRVWAAKFQEHFTSIDTGKANSPPPSVRQTETEEGVTKKIET